MLPVLLAASLLAPPPAAAQAPTAQELRTKGITDYNNQKFSDAVAVFDQFIETYPKHPDFMQIRYYAGICHFQLGDYEKARDRLKDLEKLPQEQLDAALFYYGAACYFTGQLADTITALEKSAKPTDPKLPYREFALFYLARAKADLAGSLASKPADAKKLRTEAIGHLDTYTTDFPESELKGDALYSRATLYMQIGEFSKAQRDLETFKTLPESQESPDQIDYLIGFSLNQQAQQLLSEFRETDAQPFIDKARAIFERLTESQDLLVVNDAVFQLANLLFKEKNYAAALDRFRSVRSRGALIASQQARLDLLRKQLQEAANNAAQLTRINRQLKREAQELATVRNNPELAVEALIRVGDCYLQLGDYDKARTVYRHAQQFASPEQINSIRAQIIVSQAIQGLVQQAEQDYETFRRADPKNPSLEIVPFLMGSALLQQGKFQAAIDAFQRNLREYPQSSATDQIPALMARCYMGLGDSAKAIQSYRDFIQQAKSGKLKVSAASIEDTERQLAAALAGQDKTQEAVDILRRLISSATTPVVREDATFLLVDVLRRTGKTDEAAATLAEYRKQFPDSARSDQAAYLEAGLLDIAGKFEETIAALRAFIQNYPDNPLTLNAYEFLARTYEKNKDFEGLVAVQEEYRKAFPDEPRTVIALYTRGKFIEDFMNNATQAVAAYEHMAAEALTLPDTVRKTSAWDNVAKFTGYGLMRGADLLRKIIQARGRYADLPPEEQGSWKENILKVEALLSQSIGTFPHPEILPYAFRSMLATQLLLVNAGLKDINQAATYFTTLAGSTGAESIRLQAEIARASLYYEAGQSAQSLNLYRDVFAKIKDPQQVGWLEYERFGTLLLDNQQWADAEKIYRTIQQSFNDPKNPTTKQAQAFALYGIAAALQGQGNLTESTRLFAQLKELYPDSPKILQADLSRSWSDVQLAAKITDPLEAGLAFDKAFASFEEVIKNPRSTNELRAQAMMKMAMGLEMAHDRQLKTSANQPAQEGGPPLQSLEVAVNYLIKIDLYYEAFPAYASEALYHAARLEKKRGRPAEAKTIADDLIKRYPTTTWARKVNEVL